MSKPKNKKSGSKPRRNKPHRSPASAASSGGALPVRRPWPEPPPRTDGYLDDGPEEPSGPWDLASLSLASEIYTVTRSGMPPFADESLDPAVPIPPDLDDEAHRAAFHRVMAEADAEGRSVMERLARRDELDDLVARFVETLDGEATRAMAPRIFHALIAYVDTILKPTSRVVFAWIHPDLFAEALPRLLPLTNDERVVAFSVLASLFRWHASSGLLNDERAERLSRDFLRLAEEARLSREPMVACA